jgi:hypothetical protein
MNLSIPHCALSVFLLSWTVLERFNIPHFLNIVELIINDALHFQTFLPSFRLCALYSYFQLPPLPLGSLNVEATVEIEPQLSRPTGDFQQLHQDILIRVSCQPHRCPVPLEYFALINGGMLHKLEG